MARIFLDANYYIGIVKRKNIPLEPLQKHLLFISPLSTHVLFYSYKVTVPNKKLLDVQETFGVVPFTEKILNDSLVGPTKDLEDNVQLHSAIEAECDYFLTLDKKLLKMKFFGKTRIVNKLTNE